MEGGGDPGGPGTGDQQRARQGDSRFDRLEARFDLMIYSFLGGGLYAERRLRFLSPGKGGVEIQCYSE